MSLDPFAPIVVAYHAYHGVGAEQVGTEEAKRLTALNNTAIFIIAPSLEISKPLIQRLNPG